MKVLLQMEHRCRYAPENQPSEQERHSTENMTQSLVVQVDKTGGCGHYCTAVPRSTRRLERNAKFDLKKGSTCVCARVFTRCGD